VSKTKIAYVANRYENNRARPVLALARTAEHLTGEAHKASDFTVWLIVGIAPKSTILEQECSIVTR
jgi:hypothetical protein